MTETLNAEKASARLVGLERGIARNRYAVLGGCDLCALPAPGLQARIVTSLPEAGLPG